jgi:hypothetical protein
MATHPAAAPAAAAVVMVVAVEPRQRDRRNSASGGSSTTVRLGVLSMFPARLCIVKWLRALRCLPLPPHSGHNPATCGHMDGCALRLAAAAAAAVVSAAVLMPLLPQ